MAYDILTVGNSGKLLIRSRDDEGNALLLGDLRDLLQLRSRLNAFINTQEPDGGIDAPPVSEHEMVSAVQAREEAAEDGIDFGEPTLRLAMTRGTIPGAEKRGRRWWLPRRESEKWLKGYRSRT
jgi:hypothetical protein